MIIKTIMYVCWVNIFAPIIPSLFVAICQVIFTDSVFADAFCWWYKIFFVAFLAGAAIVVIKTYFEK